MVKFDEINWMDRLVAGLWFGVWGYFISFTLVAFLEKLALTDLFLRWETLYAALIAFTVGAWLGVQILYLSSKKAWNSALWWGLITAFTAVITAVTVWIVLFSFWQGLQTKIIPSLWSMFLMWGYLMATTFYLGGLPITLAGAFAGWGLYFYRYLKA